ncbi:hypothetical protein A3B45_01270 [Candidatus Daviesbacteria bacterium RIFCSPLOWO2_01_FULL_39_12]|uniref:Uncharacterized protein n=1 Tax=Candidatus Daviesbacteria bacterium RIFCSPLOWO2_01_FULL_39_12 TaxID=1797785 RepID=A0A1F5KS58_9BACT|nr:MAG: hypothetical protein A3B45_01270 [Candidatus Daviesbacteria bacterium RIFCSPLOWO2_01_FULL_39_12]
MEKLEPQSFVDRVTKSPWARAATAVLGIVPLSCNYLNNQPPAEVRFVSDQTTMISSAPTERRYLDVEAQALADFLKPIIGGDFQILVVEEPLIAKSAALLRKAGELSGEPLGHNVYNLPDRDLLFKVGTIDYGQEYQGTIRYFVTKPDASGRNSIWAVSSEVNPETSRLEYRFINDLDGGIAGDSFSLNYRAQGNETGEYFAGSELFTPGQIWTR